MDGFLKSFVYALRGLSSVWKDQRNLKVQLMVAVVVIGVSFYLQISLTEWYVVLIMIALVLTLEMINTAIENLVNLFTAEYHPLAGKIKDIAAGAVLLASVFAAIIGGIIFYRNIF